LTTITLDGGTMNSIVTDLQIKFAPNRTRPDKWTWKLTFNRDGDPCEMILRYKDRPLVEDTPINRQRAVTIAEEYLNRWYPRWDQ